MRPPHWKHERDFFYKYVDSKTAKKIIGSGQLRWSAASCFNDPFDSQFDLCFEYNRDELVEAVLSQNWDIVSGQKIIVPGNPLGAMLTQWGSSLAKRGETEFKRMARKSTYESVARAEKHLPQVQQAMRKELMDFKYLCLGETYDQILMWSHYAKHHTGAVIQLTCDPAVDSTWGIASPVNYHKKMPRLLSQDEFIRFLGGEISLSNEITLEKIILSKAEEWSYEKEWRVCLAGTNSAESWEDIPFHESELTALYLGCNISATDKDEIVGSLKDRYPRARLFQARKSAINFAIEFHQF